MFNFPLFIQIFEALVPQHKEGGVSPSRPTLFNSSPDKLLTNRLCGQCHSYFDSQNWRPYDHIKDSLSTVPIVAHMEEVVFDVSLILRQL